MTVDLWGMCSVLPCPLPSASTDWTARDGLERPCPATLLAHRHAGPLVRFWWTARLPVISGATPEARRTDDGIAHDA